MKESVNDKLSGLIWVLTVCKCYQQKTKMSFYMKINHTDDSYEIYFQLNFPESKEDPLNFGTFSK